MLPAEHFSTYSESPSFLGHAGVGARISTDQNSTGLVLRETMKSQLIIIIPLGCLCVLPSWILFSRPDQINSGVFGKSLLLISVVVCIPFFLKYLVRLLKNQGIVVDRRHQEIRFMVRRKVVRSLSFSQVRGLEMKVSSYRSDGLEHKNFTLVLTDTQGTSLSLCISENEQNIRRVQKLLAQTLFTSE